MTFSSNSCIKSVKRSKGKCGLNSFPRKKDFLFVFKLGLKPNGVYLQHITANCSHYKHGLDNPIVEKDKI